MPDEPIQSLPPQYRLIGSDGVEYGPAPADEVRVWIREGRASAKTLVRSDDHPAWRKLGELPEFAEAIALRAANSGSTGNATANAEPGPEQNKTARMGFIFSLVSLLCCCVLLAPVGLVISIIAMVRINAGKDLKEGYRFALAGIVISVLVIIINIVAWLWLPEFLAGRGAQPVIAP